MKAQTLFNEGRLSEAVAAAGESVRDNPADVRLRTFLFELLCFAGEYERAEKHLALLAGGNKDREVGALLYHAAIHAQQTRDEMFASGETPIHSPARVVGGVLNGAPVEAIEDADPRIGPRLEVYAAGNYMWVPFEHVASLKIEPPKRVRDLLWAPALLRTGPGFKNVELGEVLIPVLAPGSARHPDEQVRLGRMSVWDEANGTAIPYGQKSLLVDGEEVPFLEIRSLTIGQPDDEETDAAA